MCARVGWGSQSGCWEVRGGDGILLGSHPRRAPVSLTFRTDPAVGPLTQSPPRGSAPASALQESAAQALPRPPRPAPAPPRLVKQDGSGRGLGCRLRKAFVGSRGGKCAGSTALPHPTAMGSVPGSRPCARAEQTPGSLVYAGSSANP